MKFLHWNLPDIVSPPTSMRFDAMLLFACISLMSIGYVMVCSASLHMGANTFYYPMRQFIHIIVGLFFAGAVIMLKTEVWQRVGPGLFLVGLVLLVVVLIPGVGVKVKGSVRWLPFYGMRIQVSEIVKFCTVVYMAGYVTRHGDALRESAYGLLKPLLLFTVACILLLREPDFGSSVVILVIAMGVMFLSGARMWQFFMLMIIIMLLAALLVYIEPYRMARVTSFLNPWADPRDSGYQLIQALMSFGRGEWLGVGLGAGIQKLDYLPEAHTDFLFSVLSEELGLVGVVTVIALFALLICRAFAIGVQAERNKRPLAAFIAYGMGIWFGFQSFVNMGVNMGMLPTKGLTLPMMSYGGGSMVVMCSAVALLFRIHYENEMAVPEKQVQQPRWVQRYE